MSDLSVLIEETRTEKKTKGESKHYIPFNKTEWEAMEKFAGRTLEPKDLKLMLTRIFDGSLVVRKPDAK